MSGYRLSIGNRASVDVKSRAWLAKIAEEHKVYAPGYNDFDEILEDIGGEGKYQKFLLYGFVGPVSLMVPFFMFNIVFMLYEPEHWCHVPGRDNNTDIEAWKNLTLPLEYGVDGIEHFSECTMLNGTNNGVVPCKYGWEYDRSDYEDTIPSQFNWVCDKGHYGTDALTFASAGNAFGAILLGPVADRTGRKPVFFLLCVANIFFRVCSLLSASEFILFLVFQFIHGMAFPLMYIVSTMLVCEISSKEYRAWIYSFTWIMWVLGFSALPLLAWATRTWYLMGMVTSLPGIFLLVFWKFVPESPAWLVSRGEIREAIDVILKIAKVNGTMDKLVGKNLEVVLKDLSEKNEEQKHGVLTLFSKPRLARNTIMICIMWATNNMVNFGITLITHKIPGNQFFNFFALGVTEVPAAYLGGMMADLIGRRWTQVVFYFMCAVSCAGAGAGYWFFAGNICIVLVFAILAKFAITVTFLVTYIQVTELFPTQLRSTGSAMASMVGSGMTIAAPYSAYFGKVHPALPYLFLAIMSFAGTLAASFVPETLNQKLPDSIDEADRLGLKKNPKMFSKGDPAAEIPQGECVNKVTLQNFKDL